MKNKVIMNYKKYSLLSILFLGISMMVSPVSLEDKKAPQFTAKMVNSEGKVQDFMMKDYLGKLLVLYFYPMDNTPGCTEQAKIFRDNIEKLASKGISVIGVSKDSIKSHQKFQKKHHLPFPLISDSRWSGNISKLYGADGFLYSKRKTFLINKKGTVVKVFDDVDIQHQIDDILKAFKEYL